MDPRNHSTLQNNSVFKHETTSGSVKDTKVEPQSDFAAAKSASGKTSLNDVKLNGLTKVYAASATNLTVSRDTTSLFQSTIPKPTFVIAGSGAALQTDKGLVIDFSAQVVNCVLGQNDPWVKGNQIAYLMSDRPSYVSQSLGGHEIYFSYPQRLAKLNVGNIKNPVINFRQCNGSDAVELAIIAARAYSDKQSKKRPLLVSFKGSYHGQSLAAYLTSDVLNDKVFLVPKPDNVIFLDLPPHASNMEEEKLTPQEMLVLQKFEMICKETFAVLIEPIQMNHKAHTFSKAFLKALNELCRQNDVCFILDEIQTGMGWLGHLTLAEKLDLHPDIIALGKGLTSGHGALALIIADKKYNYLPDRTGGKTNGAGILPLIAANSVLDRLVGLPEEEIGELATGNLRKELREGLLKRSKEISKELDKHVEMLQKLFPDHIGKIRGFGVIRTLEILDDEKKPNAVLANKIHLAAVSHGVFVRNNESELLIKMPLTITNHELELGFSNLKKALIQIFTLKKQANELKAISSTALIKMKNERKEPSSRKLIEKHIQSEDNLPKKRF